MNKNDAKVIAETITNEQLKQMFDAAKNGVLDWRKPSVINKGITKGTAWNVLAKDFDVSFKYPLLSKKNMIREFGDFLPKELLKPKNKASKPLNLIHQEPKF